jgi:hypothetical protein
MAQEKDRRKKLEQEAKRLSSIKQQRGEEMKKIEQEAKNAFAKLREYIKETVTGLASAGIFLDENTEQKVSMADDEERILTITLHQNPWRIRIETKNAYNQNFQKRVSQYPIEHQFDIEDSSAWPWKTTDDGEKFDAQQLDALIDLVFGTNLTD